MAGKWGRRMKSGGGGGGAKGPGVAKAVAVARFGVGVIGGWKIGLVLALVFLILLMLTGLFVAVSGGSIGEGSTACVVVGKNGDQIPANYVPWLEKAAAKYKLGPRGFAIVAAVHKIESDFGRSPLPGVSSGENEAGAGGPGQFLAATWDGYGVDADGDGAKDRYSVPDSIFATANYLHASGAPKDWYSAIFAYNHADWYVEDVLRESQNYSAEQTCAASATGPLGELPSEPVQRIEYVARWIERKHLPYCWGGGHGPKPGPSSGEYCWTADGRKVVGSSERGLDCSGAVRWLLVLAGYKDPGPLVSSGFATAYQWGAGRSVTIWSNVAHVFIVINGRAWGTSESNFAHGPGFAEHTTAGFVPSHPEGV